MYRFESIWNIMHFNNNDNTGTYQEPCKLFKIYPVLSHLNTYLLERKKMTKWYIKLFRRLLNTAVLNCMVIWSANSGKTKIDHFKFRVELVHALLIEHASESGRKFQGHYRTDKNVPRLVERHFPERILTEKKARPTERCVVCYKSNRSKETVFWCPKCEAALCVEECFKAFHTELHF
jgi:hypothetical protein